MKLIIDIDENVFTRLFDNSVDTSSDDREVIDSAIRNGKPYEEKTGHWVSIAPDCRGYTDTFECSYCKGRVCRHYSMKYNDFEKCPRCGAKMGEE